MGAMEVEGPEDPRAFTEVILNIRDLSVVDFYSLEDGTPVGGFDSFSDPTSVVRSLIGLKIRLDRLELPKPAFNPQVSRVDGNHRLSGFDEISLQEDEENGSEAPIIPFAILLGLDKLQEAKLFRDINGTPKKMETDHLLRIEIRRLGEGLKLDPNKRALWISDELAVGGRAFEGKVFFGGSKAGIREKTGEVPPLRFNTLRRAISEQLSASQKVSVLLRDQPEAQLALIDAYWKAVASLFPEAWTARKNFILLQTIGLQGFAIYGGHIIDTAFEEGKVTEHEFRGLLQPIAGVPLGRSHYEGIAGAGGARRIAAVLTESADPEAAQRKKILEKRGVDDLEAKSEVLEDGSQED